MKKDIVIVGAGGCGREALYYLNRENQLHKTWNFLGFIDNTENEMVIGDDSWLLKRDKEIFVVLAIGSPAIRKKLYLKYSANKNIKFPNIIDPSAIICEELVEMGQGNIICANTTFTTNIKMGDFNIVSMNATIAHDIVAESFITINPGCNISGNVFIGDMSYIGAGTQIIQGKRIGNGAVIGAGAVVVSDIEENVTVVGVPAKPIKKRGK